MVFRDGSPRIDQATGQWRLMQGALAPGETVRMTIRSGSMLPLMPVGDEIEVASAVGTTCRVGDVVVFRRRDKLIAHRLLLGWGHNRCGWFLERGDGLSSIGVVRARSILGRVLAIHHADGRQQRLDAPETSALATRQARRSLARFMLGILAAPLRKAKRWLHRDSTGSA